MFRAALIWLCLASAGASRIKLEEDTRLKIDFGASCENLQTRFHNQVHAFRVAVEAHTSESAVTQARLAMRMHGIIRTLRRAQSCDWVVENDSEDIEEMRGIMQELLAGNACADAARLELEAGASTEAETSAAIPRAMLILLSDDCEVPEIQPTDDAQTPEQVEEGLQDAIDEIMDAEDEGESLMQLDQTGRFQRFMRGVGIVFLMLFLLLGCVSGVAAVAAVIGAVVAFVLMAINLGTVLILTATEGWAIVGLVGFAMYGALFSLPVGIVGCAIRLYHTVLPRLSQ